MDGSPFGARGQLGLAHPSAAHPARHVEQHGDARGVAVRGLVVGGELVRGRLQNRQRHENQHDGHEHVEHDLGGAGGMEEQRRPQDEQQRDGHHRAEVHPAKHRQRRQERLLQLGAHLAAVVTGHENDLAAARAARLGRVAGLVLRHDVLADPAREGLGQHRTVEHLGNQQQQGDQGHDEGRDGHDGQEQRQHGHDQGGAAADRAGRVGASRTAEILDDGRQAGFLLHLLGYIQRSLLLFFRSGRTRAYLLRQICNVV